MSENSNENQGRISGRAGETGSSNTPGKIAGQAKTGSGSSGIIGGGNNGGATGTGEENNSPGDSPPAPQYRKQRIEQATKSKGLKALPSNFGDSDGDWQVIESDNLFEVLYLDYRLVNAISPEVVKNNYDLLTIFWKEKRNMWESGSGQVRKSIEDKYSAKNLSNCIKKLETANEHLFTLERISSYDERLRSSRIQNGEMQLAPFLKLMTKNGEAEPNEIEGIIEEAFRYDLDEEEAAFIIKKDIDTKGFKPYGSPLGDSLSKQLLSVTWMTSEKLAQAFAEAQVKKNAGREIFDNVYAYSVEEIGEIIFHHEQDAKRDIADGLLKNSIDYFSPAKARQFVDILNAQKNEHLRYLQITYRLKPQLPYRFNAQKAAASPRELCEIISESAENFAAGKFQFKQGYPEVWLLETNKQAYKDLVHIKDRAANADLAFLEFIYTFNPSLPYRFNGFQLVKTPVELCNEIDKVAANWEAGKRELFDGSIITWLLTTHQKGITANWHKVKDQFADRQDVGLECFLHLLDAKLEYSTPAINLQKIEYPKIQGGQVITTEIIISNQSRGVIEAFISFSKEIPGVVLSADKILLSNASGVRRAVIVLSIDSNVLLKGVQYESVILISTFEQQQIEIPVSFKIVFPQNAFLLETAKYAGIFAVFFGLLRFLIAQSFPGWLGGNAQLTIYFRGFLDWNYASEATKTLALFGWTFFIFLSAIGTGIYFLIKYLLKNGK